MCSKLGKVLRTDNSESSNEEMFEKHTPFLLTCQSFPLDRGSFKTKLLWIYIEFSKLKNNNNEADRIKGKTGTFITENLSTIF